MKRTALFLALSLMGSVASADTLPGEVKDKVFSAIAEKCEWVPLRSLNELSNTVTTIHDDLRTRRVFETTYSGAFYFDGAHPLYITITVKSQELDVASARTVEVLSLEASLPYACDNYMPGQ